MRDVWMAERLRLFGAPVQEVLGWQQRGAEMGTIRGSGNHHTASANTPAVAPSLDIVTHGRGGPSPVPGPLANGLQGRNDFIYVIAAGRANHGGKGIWRGHSGNSSFWGLEIEYSGLLGPNGKPLEDFPLRRFDLAARWHACLGYYHGYGADAVWQHFQYALPKGRKIDLLEAALNLHGGIGAFCDRIQWYIDHPPFKNLPKDPTPQPGYRLDRVLSVGDRDTAGNAIVTRVENLLLLNALLRGHTGSGPGKIDKPGQGLYSTQTGKSVEKFRAYWWKKYDQNRPPSQRHLAGPKGNTVGRKVYDALVFDTLALAA